MMQINDWVGFKQFLRNHFNFIQIRIYVPNIYTKFNDLVGQFINVQSIWSIFVNSIFVGDPAEINF